MNIIIQGFSTTGKSSLLKDLEKIVSPEIVLLDSDNWISSDYNGHIYNLYIENTELSDPIYRNKAMNLIEEKENEFLVMAIQLKKPFIAALGPNVHTRSIWNEFLIRTQPYPIMLKANAFDVLKGLNRREDIMPNDIRNKWNFGCWNYNVTRQFDKITSLYNHLPDKKSIENISRLIKVNEREYEKIANNIFLASNLFEWHRNFNSERRQEVLDLIKEYAG